MSPAAPRGRLRFELEMGVPPGSDMHELLAWVGSLSELDPDRHEMEAQLYLTLARSAWRRAEELRRAARDRERRQARRERKVTD